MVGREGWLMNYQLTASNFATSFDLGTTYGFTLPGGLTLNTTTGLITGTPTETGVFDSYQQATNATVPKPCNSQAGAADARRKTVGRTRRRTSVRRIRTTSREGKVKMIGRITV